MQTKYRKFNGDLAPMSSYLPMFFFDKLKSDPPVVAPPAIKRFQVNMHGHGNWPEWSKDDYHGKRMGGGQ